LQPKQGAFPLAYCRVATDDAHQLQEIEVLEDAWTLKTRPIPLRVMTLAPDVAPHHAAPRLLVKIEGETYRLTCAPGGRCWLTCGR
jgi:hypothetical protein